MKRIFLLIICCYFQTSITINDKGLNEAVDAFTTIVKESVDIAQNPADKSKMLKKIGNMINKILTFIGAAICKKSPSDFSKKLTPALYELLKDDAFFKELSEAQKTILVACLIEELQKADYSS